MGWRNWALTLRLLPAAAPLEALAQQIAALCQVPVWERVQPVVITMPYHQARGYAQARAVLVVRQQLRQSLPKHSRLSPTQRGRLQQLVLDRVVTWVVGRAEQIRRSAPRSVRRAA